MEKRIKRVKGFFAEFKTFISRGNVLDMSVGVIVGGAFTAIVNGLSNFILKPIINWLLALILGTDSLSGIYTMLKTAYVLDENGVATTAIDLANSIYIDWGAFINAIINFLLISFVLFSIVKLINRFAEAREKLEELSKKEEKKAIRRIQKQEKLTWAQAKVRYEETVAEEKAKKAEEERIAAEKAAEEQRLAEEKARLEEEKAMANTRLLEEIRDLLKAKNS